MELSITDGHNEFHIHNEYPSEQPIITIVTATYNAINDLEWTINSIKNQKYHRIQWIIIDGASTDGTIELIKNNEEIVDLWISEPDKGIFDAWNKAINHIKGDWVQFLGAGDEYYDPYVLSNISKILSSAHPSYDIVYGKLIFISRNTRNPINEVCRPFEKIKGKWEMFAPMLPIHPEVFHHSSLFKAGFHFDASYKMAGDSHFLMRQIFRKDFLYIPATIVNMPLGGISGKFESFILATLESRRASKKLGFKPPIMHCIREGAKFILKLLILFIYPRQHLYRCLNFLRPILRRGQTFIEKRMGF